LGAPKGLQVCLEILKFEKNSPNLHILVTTHDYGLTFCIWKQHLRTVDIPKQISAILYCLRQRRAERSEALARYTDISAVVHCSRPQCAKRSVAQCGNRTISKLICRPLLGLLQNTHVQIYSCLFGFVWHYHACTSC